MATINALLEAFDGIVDIGAIATGIRSIQALRGAGLARAPGTTGVTTPSGPTSNTLGLGKVDESRFSRALFSLNDDELVLMLRLFEVLEKHQLKQMRVSFAAIPDSLIEQKPKNDGKDGAKGGQQNDQHRSKSFESRDVEVLKGIARSVKKNGEQGTIKLLLASGMITLTTVGQDTRKKIIEFFDLDPSRAYSLEEFDAIAVRKIRQLPHIEPAVKPLKPRGLINRFVYWLSGN